MIRIRKPSRPPKVLADKGVTKAQAHCDDYECAAQFYRDGTRTFTFDSNIYAHKSVKAALKKAQRGKCCFCETIIEDESDVEHFRPKAAYRQTASGELVKPAYYWLAYDWSNLFLSCIPCNQRHKKNLFPLADPDRRMTSHDSEHAVADEEPLFIDPARLDPEEHISFRLQYPYPVNDSPAGRATIKSLRLDREQLNVSREERLRSLKLHYALTLKEERVNRMLKQLVGRGPSEELALLLDLHQRIQEAKKSLDEASKGNGSYSAMIRAAIKQRFWLDDDKLAS